MHSISAQTNQKGFKCTKGKEYNLRAYCSNIYCSSYDPLKVSGPIKQSRNIIFAKFNYHEKVYILQSFRFFENLFRPKVCKLV